MGSEFFSGLVSGVILTIFSTIVHQHFHLKNERQKNIINTLQKFKQKIEHIRDEAIIFHTSPSFNQTAISLIAAKITQLGIDINNFCTEHGLKTPSERVIELRKSIDLKNTNASSFQSCKKNSEIILEINIKSQRLIAHFDRLSRFKFKYK